MKAFTIFVPEHRTNAGAVRMDYRGDVSLDLKAENSWAPNSDIQHGSHITLNLGSIMPTGDLNQKCYLVTIEELSGPAENEDTREYYARVIHEKEEHDAGIAPSITRRLKSVS